MSREVCFYAPGLKRYETGEFPAAGAPEFMAVSITGRRCALNCAHCGGRLLEAMFSARGRSLLEVCARFPLKGVLVTGGCDPGGRVPLDSRLEELARLKGELGLKVLVHTGLVDESLARGLREAGVDGALLDVIGSGETVRRVYGLDVGPEAYEESLYLLCKHGVSVIPHIVLGLHFGIFLGEERALEAVSRYPISALVLVVLTPWHGTAMAEVAPPPVEEVGEFFRLARSRLPDTPILLGCACPPGEYRRKADGLALEAGFDGIAYPAPGTVARARRMGLRPAFSRLCCALIPGKE